MFQVIHLRLESNKSIRRKQKFYVAKLRITESVIRQYGNKKEQYNYMEQGTCKPFC